MTSVSSAIFKLGPLNWFFQQIKNFIHDEERKPEQTFSFYLLTGSDTKLLDDLLEKVVDIIAKNDKCKGLDNKFPSGCSITEDCFRLTCAKKVGDKDTSLKMKFNRCACLLYLRFQFSFESCILCFIIVSCRICISSLLCYRICLWVTFRTQTLSFFLFFLRCDEPVTVTIDVKVEEENWERSYVFSSGEEMALGDSGIYVRVTELKGGEGNLTFQVWRNRNSVSSDIRYIFDPMFDKLFPFPTNFSVSPPHPSVIFLEEQGA